MKYLKSILLVTLSVFVIGACGNKSENEAGGAAESAEEGLSAEQTAFVNNYQEELAKIEPLVDDIRSQIEKTSGDTKEELTRLRVDLEYKKEKLEKSIKNIQQEGVEDWDRAKQEISSQWKSMMESYQKLKKEVDDNV